ncbi:uncharacterized protein LOC128133488 [Lactuca sativa]|uniref:uncharacterized protein LOC128133488 n=1 Tax=Lactuca sativa TaxID=4236 RepID=UPI0022AF46C1|nr:uncharacterized protein LOC128133488 [Lactuca sativa]
MKSRVPEVSPVILEYKKLPYAGPRELTPAMIRSIEEADRPAKRGKKQEKQKEVRVIKAAKGKTPRKRKSDKASPSQPKQKKTKKPAQRLILQSSSDSDSEYLPTGNKQPTPTASESGSSDEEVSVRGDTPPRSPTPEVPVRSPVPSSPLASIPISLPTTFPVITSQPTSTIPIPTPLFSEATTTTTTGVETNVTDTGVRSSVPESTKPLSPTPSTETNTVLGGEDVEFDSFYYSPYRVQSDEDDDAPITKKHIKELNAKLGTLMASSSSHQPYSMLDSFVKAHDASISNATAAITASTKVCTDATEKVDKLIQYANIFLESLQGATELNASKVTSSITKLEEAFAAEKQNFATLRQDIQKDNVALLSSLNERFTKLQDDLAMENSLLDELALKTTQLKTKNLQLSQANHEVNQLRSERDVVKSCVSDVHAILSNVLETHDPILTISVRRHLADKFRPSLGMLSRIEGVSETMVPPKQGGEGLTSSSQPPPTSQPEQQKTEHASGSGFKAKGKGTVDDSDEEEETITEA